MKKNIGLFGILLTCMFLFAACGEHGSISTTTTVPPTTTLPSATTMAETTTTTETMTTTGTTTTVKTPTTTQTTPTEVAAATDEGSTTSKEPNIYRTAVRTRPSYTGPTVPTIFTEEEPHTDLKLELNRTVYYTGTRMDIRIENTTDRTITVEDARAVLKKSDSGEWEYVYKRELHGPSKIEAGDAYATQLEINTTKSTAVLGGI